MMLPNNRSSFGRPGFLSELDEGGMSPFIVGNTG